MWIRARRTKWSVPGGTRVAVTSLGVAPRLAILGAIALLGYSRFPMHPTKVESPAMPSPNRNGPAPTSSLHPPTATAVDLRNAFTFVPVECPAAANTHPTGVNDRQQVVGTCAVDGTPKSFLWEPRAGFAFFEHPQGDMTVATGINTLGEVVGFYYRATRDGSHSHGFLRRGDGSYLSFDPPGSRDTYAHSVNDSGVVVGAYVDELRTTQGFVRQPDGSFAIIRHPGAASTTPTAINNRGEVAGHFLAPGVGNRGFLLHSDGSFVTLQPDGVEPKGLNASGTVVGVAPFGGFLALRGESPGRLEHPACTGACTIPTGVNNDNAVVGQYQLSSGVYGFMASRRSVAGR